MKRPSAACPWPMDAPSAACSSVIALTEAPPRTFTPMLLRRVDRARLRPFRYLGNGCWAILLYERSFCHIDSNNTYVSIGTYQVFVKVITHFIQVIIHERGASKSPGVDFGRPRQ